MYLKSIELTGFKSFAKRSELVFSSPISAIVGPNGSGKSNIAEAFRFVLGEQSIKSLRGKRGEDLIFNGAGDLPRGNLAAVKVVFDNSLKIFPLDFETVTVERKVARDSVNEYLINGSPVRLRDVVELLASAHIGSSGHHIISQGEADRILSASIKERKSMIEDALGLKLYQYKKQESEKKLVKTRGNIAQTQSLRREIAPHLRYLKKQVEKVEKSLEMKNDLQEKALEYCNRENEYINRTEKRLLGEKGPLEYKQKELDAELSQAKAVLLKGTTKDTTEEIIALEVAIRGMRNEKDNLFREFGKIDGELASLVRMVRKQEEVAHSFEHRTVSLVSVETLSGHIEQKISQAKGVAKETNNVEILLEILDVVMTLIADFIDGNKEKIDNSLIDDSKKEIEQLRESKKEVENSLENVKRNETELSLRYEALKAQIEKEKDSNRDAEKAVFRIMTESQEVHSKLELLKQEEETLRIIREDFKRELSELGMMLGTAVLRFESLIFDYIEPRTVQEERRRAIEKIKIRLEDAGGAGGADVMKEYTEATERDTFLEKELTDLEKTATSLTELIADLDMRLSTEFKAGVEKINKQFKEFFSLMFGGGTAELSVILESKRKSKDESIFENAEGYEEIETKSDTLEGSDGIDIDVSLPKKKVKGLMMLSGGERALTSIALLFAISQVNPPPFIILDETDAALDEANSKKYADMVENLSRHSQLIVITHNRETMSRAGILYGVTMASGGGSRLLSVAFDEAVAVAK
jgi:chromosome segregation protein